MNRFYPLALLCLFALTSQNLLAQIPNGDFETWTTAGAYEDPNGWVTANPNISGLTSTKDFSTLKSTDANGGSFSAELHTKTNTVTGLGTFQIPGVLTNGMINLLAQTAEGGQPWTSKPQFLKGWYKYSPAGGDSSLVRAIFTVWTGTKTDTLADVSWSESGTVTSWTEFSEYIDWLDVRSPDTVQIVCLSSADFLGGSAGSTLLLDDLSLDGTNFLAENERPQIGIKMFPNPAKSDLEFQFDQNISGSIVIYDIVGNKIGSYETDGNNKVISVADFQDGLYLYQLVGTEGSVVASGRFKVIK